MKKIKIDNAVFSSGYDENDIDQTPTFIGLMANSLQTLVIPNGVLGKGQEKIWPLE